MILYLDIQNLDMVRKGSLEAIRYILELFFYKYCATIEVMMLQ